MTTNLNALTDNALFKAAPAIYAQELPSQPG